MNIPQLSKLFPIGLLTAVVLCATTPVALTPIAASGPYPTAGVIVTLTVADAANGNSVVSSGRDLIIAFNSDSAPHTVTITSQVDQFGRLGTITAESLAAGAYHIFGPLAKTAWANSSGVILLSASDATVKFAVIQIP